MIKTQGKSSITISKLAFLDEMLPEPSLERDVEDYTDDVYYSLENIDKLLELVKKLAAKVLTEEELVNMLGDKSKDRMFGVSTYTPNSKEITH